MAKCKIVTYDLCGDKKDYQDLIVAIESYPNTKITESCWFLVTNDSPVEIRDNLSQYLDTDDRIFVGSLDVSAAWKNIIGNNTFIKTNIQSMKK
ncbi:hypothetical protein [Clostridium ganghwense]|uniref:CRISPR-associated protein Cas2 n=1 Tax=Clostridium ganghwense TaxID=312089 RepID=A0ABT4CUI6_9CLOT|nr:hypothetical protein [Clostridium ganghwense]MCY6372588.1 hypothetical protein [Clostridium ganghwense]